MAINILKEQEKQTILLYVLAFLVAFALLFWFFPPSFGIPSPEEAKDKEKKHLEIVKILKNMDEKTKDLSVFYLIPEFDGDLGRKNPFFIERITDEAPEEEEPEEAIDRQPF